MNFYLGILSIGMLLTTSACTSQKLSVESAYVTRESLASYHVGTPDPCLNAPNVGQRLYIRWRLPTNYLELEPLQLKMHLRFHNRKFALETISITKLNASYVYELLNEKFFETEGLMAYKIEIIGNGIILDEWHHIMWADPITFDDSP